MDNKDGNRMAIGGCAVYVFACLFVNCLRTCLSAYLFVCLLVLFVSLSVCFFVFFVSYYEFVLFAFKFVSNKNTRGVRRARWI